MFDEGMDVCGKITQKKVGCSLLPLSVFDRTEFCFLGFLKELELFSSRENFFKHEILPLFKILISQTCGMFGCPEYGLSGIPIADMFARYRNPEGTSVSDVADGRYLYPIPQNQMAITPGLYKQNAGY